MSIDKTKNIPVTYENSEPAPIHLTMRGKLAAAVLTGVAVLGAAHGIVQANSVEFSDSTHSNTAGQGDTLWDMAGSVQNVDGHKQEAIDEAEKMSPDLRDGSLDIGDEVIFPDKVVK